MAAVVALILVATSSAKPFRRSNPPLRFGRGLGQRPVHSVRAALREHFGGDVDADGNDNGDETTFKARHALLQFVVKFEGSQDAQAMCDAAEALPRSSCDFVYTSVFDGVAVTVTLPQLDDLLTAHGGTVSLAEASLQVHADAIQTGATWGIDRIDQASLPLNSQYVYQTSGPEAGEGAKVFVLDTGIRCSHQDIAGRCEAGCKSSNVTPLATTLCQRLCALARRTCLSQGFICLVNCHSVHVGIRKSFAFTRLV